jgi:transposase
VFSRIVYLNQYQLLPVARTAESMNDLFECPVSLAIIQRAAKVCSDKLMRYEYQLKAAVRNSEVIRADETGIKINGQVNWVHVARTDSLTHFAAYPKRGKEAFEAIGIINRFEGVLVRDGWTAYRKYEQCRHSLCNAHLLRDLTFVGENEPRHREWTGKLAGLLLEIKAAVEAARSMEQDSLPDCEQQRYLNHYDGILEQAEQAVRGSPVRRAPHLCAPTLYRRFCNYKTEVLRFMTDFDVPFDNNGSERDLRMLKLQQKISGCFRSAAGAGVFCRVRSYLSSARKQGGVLLSALESALKGQPIRLII